LQIDLLTNAATTYYTGTATTNATVDNTSELTYSDLMRVAITLDNNRTPKQTKIITGTRNIDTKTIPACRVAYCGSEMIHTLEAMKDLHGERAFIPVNQYAAGTTLLKGERGSVGEFRFIVVPNMFKWSGAGAGTPNSSYHATGSKYDVFPILIVGDESFTTIGFQTDGKSNKFETVTRKPGIETADRNDPYGEMGFSSIKWWYGFMGLRTERIAVIKTSAKM
jgi:N4-gp56 family major capsid protein